MHPQYDSFLERWGSVIADAAIGFGIVGEVIFSRKDSRIQTELRKRSNKQLEDAVKEASEANRRAAETAAVAEQLRFENLTLHRVMMPRHVGAVGFDGPPPAQIWFAGVQAFPGTNVVIQFVSDAEAQNLAHEIALVLQILGWKPVFTDESKSHVSLALMEGVRVMSSYLDNRPWTAEDLELVPYTNCAHAGDTLALALTAAGLGVGNFPIHCTRFASRPTEEDKRSRMIPWFEPPGPIVYVQVGARPIAATLQWMASQRKPTGAAAQGDANNVAATNPTAREPSI